MEIQSGMMSLEINRTETQVSPGPLLFKIIFFSLKINFLYPSPTSLLQEMQKLVDVTKIRLSGTIHIVFDATFILFITRLNANMFHN